MNVNGVIQSSKALFEKGALSARSGAAMAAKSYAMPKMAISGLKANIRAAAAHTMAGAAVGAGYSYLDGVDDPRDLIKSGLLGAGVGFAGGVAFNNRSVLKETGSEFGKMAAAARSGAANSWKSSVLHGPQDWSTVRGSSRLAKGPMAGVRTPSMWR